jgi:hypothetical protein
MKGHRYDPDSDPVQSWLIDQIASGAWRRIAITAGAQVGKTLTGIILPALHRAIELGTPVGYALPTIHDLDRAWPEKLRPAIEGSGFSDWLPKRGGGARGGRGAVVQFQDPRTSANLGSLVWMAAKAYSSSCPLVLIDEIDQWITAKGEPRWSDIEDIFARANAYGDQALRIVAGTVEGETIEQSPVLQMVTQQGTEHRPWPRCPRCGEWHRVDLGDCLRYDYDPESPKLARETARIVCPGCGELYDEDERQRSLVDLRMVARGQAVDQETGEVVGDLPPVETLGLLWPPLQSPMNTLQSIAEKEHEARKTLEKTGDWQQMGKFYRYQRLEPYEPPAPAGEIDRRWLRNTKTQQATHLHGTVPRWARVLVVSVDVQDDRLYWWAQAAEGAADSDHPGMRWCMVAAGVEDLGEPGCQASVAQLHAGMDRIDEMSAAGWLIEDEPLDDGDRMAASLGGVDMGHRPKDIAPWLRKRTTPRRLANGRTAPAWIGCRGAGRDAMGRRIDAARKLAVPSDCRGWMVYYRSTSWRCKILRIEHTAVLGMVHAELLTDGREPGAGLLPSDAEMWHCRHLAGIRWSEQHGRWIEHTQRHDLLDCATYARGLMELALQRASAGDPAPAVPSSVGASTGNFATDY